jgi:hypothetical protein
MRLVAEYRHRAGVDVDEYAPVVTTGVGAAGQGDGDPTDDPSEADT